MIHAHRGGDDGGSRTPCVHRTRPIEESLREFYSMKLGKYKPGEAILCMKQDLDDPSPQMWDSIAYHVLRAPRHRMGNLKSTRHQTLHTASLIALKTSRT
jgi:glutaminyl-tRNA synthetase